MVSTSVITLRERQERNKKIERLKNILIAGSLLGDGKDIEKKFNDNINPIYIELETGQELSEAREAGQMKNIPKNKDIAGIKRVPYTMIVYFVKDADGIDQLILPIHGKGLWSTMYGFLSLDFADLNTIKGITFYEHGETPGLGGEIDNPVWKESWRGKKVFDKNGTIKISVIKGKTRPGVEYEVDGLTGATITTRGVDNLIKFWLGSEGYGPFIKRFREERKNG
jgi:Na+-transporting NADH:ubiquinone oxidoreductase subunit C